MNLIKNANLDNFCFDFVNILNGVLQLSNRESEVFSHLLIADYNGYSDDVNNRKVRNIIKSKLGVSEANLSRYLGTIKAKNLIIRGEDNRWVINDNIKPVIEYNKETGISEVKINFIININNDKDEVKVAGKYIQGN